MPSVGRPAMLPNTTVKISVFKSGWMMTQAGPRIVCL